jgi:hypothetical protein
MLLLLLLLAGGAATGADPNAVAGEFVEQVWPDRDADEPSNKPISCSLAEVLLRLGLDVSGVADLHLGTSWLHEAVRCGGGGERLHCFFLVWYV